MTEAWRLRYLDAPAAQAVLAWRYPPPYDLYNAPPGGDGCDAALAFLTDVANGYYRMDSPAGEFLAFCCFGADAQVPGGDYAAPALDVGLGLRPDLTGHGLGTAFVRTALAFGTARFAPVTWRVTIAAFNLRAQKVWQRLGFEQRTAFDGPDGRRFVILVRDTESAAQGPSA